MVTHPSCRCKGQTESRCAGRDLDGGIALEAIRIEFGVRAPLCVRSGLTFHVGAAMGEAKAEAGSET